MLDHIEVCCRLVTSSLVLRFELGELPQRHLLRDLIAAQLQVLEFLTVALLDETLQVREVQGRVYAAFFDTVRQVAQELVDLALAEARDCCLLSVVRELEVPQSWIRGHFRTDEFFVNPWLMAMVILVSAVFIVDDYELLEALLADSVE